MAVLDSVVLPDWGYDVSYAAAQRMTGKTRVTVDTVNPALALREAIADGNVPAFLARPYRTVPLYCTSHSAQMVEVTQAGTRVIDVSYTYEAGHLLESNFLLTAQCSLQSEQRSTDAYGQPLYVYYTPPEGAMQTQIGETDFNVPTAELVAVGLYKTDSPAADVVDVWLNKINTDAFAGFAAQTMLCTAVDFVPWNYETTPRTYKFTFRFTARTINYWQGLALYPWTAKILYRDENTGYPPGDVTYTNGFAQYGLYGGLDYSTTAPLGIPEE